jgi:hypothetical protein
MNKRRGRLFLGVLTLGLAVLVALGIYQTRDRGRIRYENLDKIAAGMSMAEVERILGCPPGNYASGPLQQKLVAADGESVYISLDFSRSEFPAMRGGTIFVWLGDRGEIGVEFDEEGTVIGKEYHKGRRVPAAWWQYLEKKLGFDS